MWRKVSRFLTSRFSELRNLCLFFHISAYFDCSWECISEEKRLFLWSHWPQNLQDNLSSQYFQSFGLEAKKNLLVSSLNLASMRHTLVSVRGLGRSGGQKHCKPPSRKITQCFRSASPELVLCLHLLRFHIDSPPSTLLSLILSVLPEESSTLHAEAPQEPGSDHHYKIPVAPAALNSGRQFSSLSPRHPEPPLYQRQ